MPEKEEADSAAAPSHQDLVDALHRRDQAAEEEHLARLKERAQQWAEHPNHPKAKR
ncbi:hypothetical protein [Streptomyces griseorubiginosus]|uniref:hypothetical protein n=1 Tax=Streptomyces griseorubiginosus TaxID=67304 RepID=UPI0036E6B60F